MGSGIPRTGARTASGAIATVVVFLAVVGADDAPSQKTVLQRAGAAVVEMAAALPTLVTTETFRQASRPRGSVGESKSRVLVAEFAWVQIPGEFEPVAFRDVVEVDGRTVGDRARLVDLVHGDRRVSSADVRRVLEEGARHNLAPGSRNFNLPTVALFFLHPGQQERFKWSRRSAPESPVWELTFSERDRPTVIRLSRSASDDRPESVFSRGRVRIVSATGAVERTVLELSFPEGRYTLTTEFARNADLDLVVPVRLTERYETPEEIVTGTATYADFRRFQTTGRLLP